LTSNQNNRTNEKNNFSNSESIKLRTPLYFYIILFSIPLLFFFFLELGLRIFNYGDNLTLWVSASPGKTIINPLVAKRYFSNVKDVPSTIEDIFDSTKAKNCFRVFVLGESSAAGFPYMPMGSFSRYIRKRLELTYPSVKIEVVNIALSATNSYTIRDFIPEVLEQKPDLILIYAGHNEYYGALGVGSLESIGRSRSIVNAYLFVQKFKTTILLRDFIQWIASKLLEQNDNSLTGTLMSRMAKEKQIEINSDLFNKGLSQFEGNLKDIILEIRKAGIPLIISTMPSNLKDQKPFISTKHSSFIAADKIFEQATREYGKNNFKEADSLYFLAKELDGLRFRAPHKINKIIIDLANTYNVSVIKVDSLFAALSPNYIPGNNLFTDHVHPTLIGFQEIGNLFYQKMIKNNFLPKEKPSIPNHAADIETRTNFIFSKFDSTVAHYRIQLLKNDWPFIDPKHKKSYSQVCQPKNYCDSSALNYLLGKNNWSKAIEDVADWYLKNSNLELYLQHMECLIYQYPIIDRYSYKLENLCSQLLSKNDYSNSFRILNALEKVRPTEFSKKWIGQIALNEKRYPQAIKYLNESIQLNDNDNQVFYNLAGAYALNTEYEKAYKTINIVLSKDQNYPGAQQLKDQLKVFVIKTK